MNLWGISLLGPETANTTNLHCMQDPNSHFTYLDQFCSHRASNMRIDLGQKNIKWMSKIWGAFLKCQVHLKSKTSIAIFMQWWKKKTGYFGVT